MNTESWNQAIQRGFNPSEYKMSPLPKDEWTARLDARIWVKSKNLICYFSTSDGQKYALSAFRARQGTNK